MITVIRKTIIPDLPKVMEIFDYAREYMDDSGNRNQWTNGYPTKQLIVEDIDKGFSYVCENHLGEIIGTFCFIIGEDPTYRKIYKGNWLNDELYGTVHRLATSGSEKGVGKACFEWCFNQISNIRVDTHHDNKVMKHILNSQNFKYCGIIYLQNGDERLAYQKIIYKVIA